MLTKTDVIEQRKQMQENIKCILHGIDDNKIIDNICQVIVDRCNILSDKILAKSESKGFEFFEIFSNTCNIKLSTSLTLDVLDNPKAEKVSEVLFKSAGIATL